MRSKRPRSRRALFLAALVGMVALVALTVALERPAWHGKWAGPVCDLVRTEMAYRYKLTFALRGMSRAEVIAKLGPPDDVVPPQPGGYRPGLGLMYELNVSVPNPTSKPYDDCPTIRRFLVEFGESSEKVVGCVVYSFNHC